MNKRFGTIVLDTAFRFIIPFLMVYAVYVLVHGEDSPGGGFQAGALLGITVVLSRLVHGDEAILNINGNKALMIAGSGTFIYGLVGVVPILCGGNFLEYGKLPFVLPGPQKHALGILGIEIGVTLCVMATIIVIFDALVGREEG